MRKLEFYVPKDHVEKVKEAVFAAGAGKIGNYDKCCWCSEGTGQFRPLEGSDPFLGSKGEVERVPEMKVEMVCDDDAIDAVVEALKKAHPYETPAYQHWKVDS
jgi:hypothetical protein